MKKNDAAKVVREYSARLTGFVKRHLHNTFDEAEDIVQDVFEQLEKTDDEQPIEQVGAWLFRVAKNRIIDRQRKKKDAQFPVEKDEETDEDAGAGALKDFADIVFDTEITPETEFLRSWVADEINAGIAELPKEQREIFIQTELLEMSFKEISAKTGIPVNTLLSRKHYAVQKLRKRLAGLHEDLVGES
jgi:RNA polymerase sigma factor (sigma-70 family)